MCDRGSVEDVVYTCSSGVLVGTPMGVEVVMFQGGRGFEMMVLECLL